MADISASLELALDWQELLRQLEKTDQFTIEKVDNDKAFLLVFWNGMHFRLSLVSFSLRKLGILELPCSLWLVAPVEQILAEKQQQLDAFLTVLRRVLQRAGG